MQKIFRLKSMSYDFTNQSYQHFCITNAIMIRVIILEMNKLTIDFQIISKKVFIPSQVLFKKWVAIALPNMPAKLTIRIVNRRESQSLNHKYRHKNHPTNILSFPDGEDNYLGDLVMCAPIVTKEARIHQKNALHHWAHLTIHGVLHLLGYDHHTQTSARKMESLEIKLLKKLNISNPY